MNSLVKWNDKWFLQWFVQWILIEYLFLRLIDNDNTFASDWLIQMGLRTLNAIIDDDNVDEVDDCNGLYKHSYDCNVWVSWLKVTFYKKYANRSHKYTGEIKVLSNFTISFSLFPTETGSPTQLMSLCLSIKYSHSIGRDRSFPGMIETGDEESTTGWVSSKNTFYNSCFSLSLRMIKLQK